MMPRTIFLYVFLPRDAPASLVGRYSRLKPVFGLILHNSRHFLFHAVSLQAGREAFKRLLCQPPALLLLLDPLVDSRATRPQESAQRACCTKVSAANHKEGL
jgi:hypothetical protein